MSVLTQLLLMCDVMLLCWANSSLVEQEDISPFEVKFHSQNFRNVLHWKCQSGAPSNLRYSVEYKVYGNKQWTACELCQAIRKHQCDLSQETSDPRQWYYARVRASSVTRNSHHGTVKEQSQWVQSSRFHPQWDTTFSPPQMRLNVKEEGIVVQIIPPRSPFRGKNNTRISVTKLQQLRFRIYVLHIDVEEVHEIEDCSKKVVIQALQPQTTYCLQATTIMPLSGRASPRSPSTCCTTL